MRKILILGLIIVSSILCTGCVNNLAIQELNQAGKQYMDKGDYQNAISRFVSCVDLDGEVFESRYNLGVAYIANKEFEKAIDELDYALKLKDMPDVHYSLAVAYEGAGLKIEDDKLSDENAETEYTNEEVIKHLNLANKAIEEFENFISLSDNNEEKENVEKHIESVKKSIISISKDYDIDPLQFSISNEELDKYNADSAKQ